MRQFTMNMDEGLHSAAKIYAARQGKPIAEIVRDLLAREIGWNGEDSDRIDIDERTAAAVLRDYSAGRISRRDAMERCGLRIEMYPEFVELMERLAVKWPEPDPERISREAEIVSDAIEEARVGAG